MLYCSGHGCSDNCKLLHHGRYHCPDSDSHGRSGYGCTLLCILLRHRRRYHPAGCAGSLRRFCHCQEQPDENRIQRVQARRCRIYRTVHVLFQPCYAADRHDSHSGCTDFHYCIHGTTKIIILCSFNSNISLFFV